MTDDDGIALSSMAHPKAPWWKLPYLWLRSLRGIPESSIVTAVLDSENLPGALGIRNTIKRWERERLVGGLHDEIEAAAKHWKAVQPGEPGMILTADDEGQLRWTKAPGPVVSLQPMNLSGGRVDYFVSIRVGDREVAPHVFRSKYKADYHVALYDWLLNGTGEEPDVMDFGPSDDHPELPEGAAPGESYGDVGALSVRLQRAELALAMISYMDAQCGEDAMKMRGIATDVTMWDRPESMWWYGKDYGPRIEQAAPKAQRRKLPTPTYIQEMASKMAPEKRET